MAHAYGHVGDANAHEWTLTVVRGGAPVDLTDYVGIAKVNNGVGTVQLECTISGNTATVVLPSACYVNAGDYDAWMQLTSPDLTAVAIIAQMQLHISEGETDNPLDPGTGIAEQLGAVLGLMGDMVEARGEANEAATAANLAAASAAAASELKILGLYESLVALYAAHPTGVAGEAYAVGDEEENAVYIWDADTQEWVSLGSLQAVAGTYQPRTDSLTEEETLADGDAFPFHDASAGLPKKTLWSSIKAALGSVFSALGHSHALDGETVTGVLPLSKGGLGASAANVAEARKALGIYSGRTVLTNQVGSPTQYVTIPFGETLPSVPSLVVASIGVSGNMQSTYHTIDVGTDYSTTGFVIKYNNSQTGNVVTVWVDWIAII